MDLSIRIQRSTNWDTMTSRRLLCILSLTTWLAKHLPVCFTQESAGYLWSEVPAFNSGPHAESCNILMQKKKKCSTISRNEPSTSCTPLPLYATRTYPGHTSSIWTINLLYVSICFHQSPQTINLELMAINLSFQSLFCL